MALSTMSVTSQARSRRASASWVSSIATEEAASAATPRGAVTQTVRGQRAANSTMRAPAGAKIATLSIRCPPPKIQKPSGAGPP